MPTKLDADWRGYKRMQIARTLDDAAFINMLRTEARGAAGYTGSRVVGMALKLMGSSAQEIMLSGYEIDRLCELAKMNPGKDFEDDLGYEFSVKALIALLDRVPVRDEATTA